MVNKKLRLELDDLIDEYIGSDYDIELKGHSITIKEEDKEAFLDQYAKDFRDKVESCLSEVEEGSGDI